MSSRSRISPLLLISIFHWVLYINELFQGVIAQKLSPLNSRPRECLPAPDVPWIHETDKCLRRTSSKHTSTSGKCPSTQLRHFSSGGTETVTRGWILCFQWSVWKNHWVLISIKIPTFLRLKIQHRCQLCQWDNKGGSETQVDGQ